MTTSYAWYNPIGWLYRAIYGAGEAPPPPPPSPQSDTLTTGGERLASQAEEAQRVEVLQEKQRRDGQVAIVPPPPREPPPSDGSARSIALRSSAELIGKTDAVTLQVQEVTPPSHGSGGTPVLQPVSVGAPVPPTLTPPTPTAPGSDDRAQRAKARAGALKEKLALIAAELPDPILAAWVNGLRGRGLPASEEEWKAMESTLADIEARVVADNHLIGVLRELLRKPLKGPGKLLTVERLEAAAARTDDGVRAWPDAEALWQRFTRHYALVERKVHELTATLHELEAAFNKPAPGDQLVFSGVMTRDDFDAQELNKINDILLGGPTAHWGGRIEKEYTGLTFAVDHHTIPSSNKTIFFRWNGDTLEIHGEGNHTRSNTEYLVSKWSDGRRRVGLDLKEKKKVVK
ncbi:MAG TPA: hypothetical protein VFS08_19615 [Gemmatimonadaceae bacterium]|nr:hypothetical protein [Gemmatimonadaceae bacterium]